MEALIRYIKTLKPEYAAAAVLIRQSHGIRFTIDFIKSLPYEEKAPDWIRAIWNADPERLVAAFMVANDDLMATLKDWEAEHGTDDKPKTDG